MCTNAWQVHGAREGRGMSFRKRISTEMMAGFLDLIPAIESSITKSYLREIKD